MISMLPGPKMIFIPGGTFQMGERGDIVTVEDFWMDETPVTVEQYREAVEAGACSPPEGPEKSNWNVAGRENHPVNCVDWYQAIEYAKWAGKRLPTEPEWEWAARGRDEARRYPWGDEPPSNQLCWNGHGNDLGYGYRRTTSPVGSYSKGNSRDGLKDMAGNVWELTSSIYHGLSIGVVDAIVIHGGSWFSTYIGCIYNRSRYHDTPDFKHDGTGFRCAL